MHDQDDCRRVAEWLGMCLILESPDVWLVREPKDEDDIYTIPDFQGLPNFESDPLAYQLIKDKLVQDKYNFTLAFVNGRFMCQFLNRTTLGGTEGEALVRCVLSLVDISALRERWESIRRP